MFCWVLKLVAAAWGAEGGGGKGRGGGGCCRTSCEYAATALSV
jgi:hypothetical protein